MTPDPVRRIENRRRIIATLRMAAETSERTAREFREKADRMEASTNALEAAGRTDPACSGCGGGSPLDDAPCQCGSAWGRGA